MDVENQAIASRQHKGLMKTRASQTSSHCHPPEVTDGMSKLPACEAHFSHPRGTYENFVEWLTIKYTKSPIWLVLIFIFFLYFFFIFTFQLLLMFSVRMNSETACVIGYNFTDESVGHKNEVLFELSWSTFATVGYGGTSVSKKHTCMGFRFLLFTEAFFGILFTCFCGSTLYARITCLYTQAQVTFSPSICLRFGDGSNHPTPQQAPFPVLEMRLMNDWAESASCEIIFAKIECMVISLGRHLQNGATVSSAREFTVENTKEKTKERVIERNIMLLVHPDRHPYVSTGVWDFRHVLNKDSPLLTKTAREEIERNNDSWPTQFNTDKEKIKEFITFNKIQVTFTGVLSLTAAPVFKIKSYDFQDLHIGSKFKEDDSELSKHDLLTKLTDERNSLSG